MTRDDLRDLLGWLAIAFVMFVLGQGCTAAHAQATPQPQTGDFLCWSQNLDWAAYEWVPEAATRFNNPVVLMTHGMTSIKRGTETEWTITADPDRLAAFLKQCFPGRPIILASCNGGGADLHTPGVYYVRQSVRAQPDRFTTYPRDRVKEPGAGSIEAFVEGKP